MVALPEPQDPTLEAADRALEAVQNTWPREYLGMSGLGAECERRLWLDFRWASAVRHNASTLKKFADGEHGETLQAERLRRVSGINLLTLDPETGRQFRFEGVRGHVAGHFDGSILGLIQAPKTWHVWEHKQVEEKKQRRLEKLKADLGEKQALEAWDPVYYGQAVLYMHFSGIDRHYLTCSTPGGRHTISVRTEANPVAASRLLVKAERIIDADRPPARISDDAGYFVCRMCDHRAVCHDGALPARNCRTCLSSTPVEGGQWQCDRFGKTLTRAEQNAGCALHLFIPDLVAGEQVDAGDDFVTYRMADGQEWRDGP